MELINNMKMPSEISLQILNYMSHDTADIIRPYIKKHPTARLMSEVIKDSNNFTSLSSDEYFMAYGKNAYSSMLLLHFNTPEEYVNEQYMIQTNQEADRRRNGISNLRIREYFEDLD